MLMRQQTRSTKVQIFRYRPSPAMGILVMNLIIIFQGAVQKTTNVFFTCFVVICCKLYEEYVCRLVSFSSSRLTILPMRQKFRSTLRKL